MKLRPGQAMLEYVLALAMMSLVAGVVGYLFLATEKSSERSRTLMCLDCP